MARLMIFALMLSTASLADDCSSSAGACYDGLITEFTCMGPPEKGGTCPPTSSYLNSSFVTNGCCICGAGCDHDLETGENCDMKYKDDCGKQDLFSAASTKHLSALLAIAAMAAGAASVAL